MNKKDLVEAIAECSGISKAQAQRAIECYHQCVKGALKTGDRVALVGFGSFSVSKRSARTGRNPQTGKEIQIAAKNIVRFKAGTDLNDAIK